MAACVTGVALQELLHRLLDLHQRVHIMAARNWGSPNTRVQPLYPMHLHPTLTISHYA